MKYFSMYILKILTRSPLHPIETCYAVLHKLTLHFDEGTNCKYTYHNLYIYMGYHTYGTRLTGIMPTISPSLSLPHSPYFPHFPKLLLISNRLNHRNISRMQGIVSISNVVQVAFHSRILLWNIHVIYLWIIIIIIIDGIVID